MTVDKADKPKWIDHSIVSFKWDLLALALELLALIVMNRHFWNGNLWRNIRTSSHPKDDMLHVPTFSDVKYKFLILFLGLKYNVELQGNTNYHATTTQAWGWWPMLKVQITRPSKKHFCPQTHQRRKRMTEKEVEWRHFYDRCLTKYH